MRPISPSTCSGDARNSRSTPKTTKVCFCSPSCPFRIAFAWDDIAFDSTLVWRLMILSFLVRFFHSLEARLPWLAVVRLSQCQVANLQALELRHISDARLFPPLLGA